MFDLFEFLRLSLLFIGSPFFHQSFQSFSQPPETDFDIIFIFFNKIIFILIFTMVWSTFIDKVIKILILIVTKVLAQPFCLCALQVFTKRLKIVFLSFELRRGVDFARANLESKSFFVMQKLITQKF